MEEGLNIDNILDDDDLGLFNDIPEPQEKEEVDDNNSNKDSEESKEDNNKELQEDKKSNKTTEINPDKLFEGSSESVGSGDDNEDEEDAQPDNGDSTSPKSDFFSSIAEAMSEEGILPNLDEDKIKAIKTAEDLRSAIDDYVNSELTEKQKRIAQALDNNVEPNVIKQYENVLNYLSNIDEETLSEENENGENLRKRIIYQDLINKGFTKERATKAVERSFNSGTDIDDAKDALESNIAFFNDNYNNMLEEAKQKSQQEIKEREERAMAIRNEIFDNNSKYFGEIKPDKKTRQKIFDCISKPIYKDPETGDFYTEIQKYESDHKDEFLVKIGLLYTLTDGFKNLDKLAEGKVKKEVKKGFRNLERTLNNTQRDAEGNLRFTGGVSEDSYLGKGFVLDI